VGFDVFWLQPELGGELGGEAALGRDRLGPAKFMTPNRQPKAS